MKRHAFTMMELLVAIALTALLLTLITTVFNQTQNAISRGAAVSELIGASRATSEQFTTDAKQMLLFEDITRINEPPGFLVIIQDVRAGVTFPTPQQHNQPESDWTPRDIRTDQIAFFRAADRLDSLTPGSNKRFDSDARAGVARVWYGHVYRNETIPVELPVTQMMLGRQALLLIGPSDTFPDSSGGVYADATGGFPLASARADTTGVVGLAGGYQLWQGVTDALAVDFDGVLFADGTGTYTTPGISIDANGWPTNAYKDSALSWAFPDPSARLIADPRVTLPATDATALTVETGQTHAALIPYVSDFAIEFAADITDDLVFDPATGTYAPGPPDGLPDNTPDTYTTPDGEAIKWYTTIDPNPDADGNYEGDNNPAQPITWPIPTAGLHSSAGSVYPPAHGSGRFVFGHTGEDESVGPNYGAGRWWPYLIRIRYRVHNRTGEFSSIDPVTGDPVSGKWFEQIIPVPR